MKKWNEMNTKQKGIIIAVPLLIVAVIISAVLFTKGNDTENVEVAVNEIETPSTASEEVLETETIKVEPTEEVENTEPEVVEPTTEPETTETVATEKENTTESTENTTNSESTVNASGEEVYNGDAADWEENYQKALNSWTKKATWTSSKGTVIKINDAYADIVAQGERNSNAIYYDGTEDLRPNSDFMNAVNEFIYNDATYNASTDTGNGADRWDSKVVDVSKLPDIPVASSKQTSFQETDGYKAYREAFDPMYNFQVNGSWEESPVCGLQIYQGGAGIGLLSNGSYIFEINALGDGTFKCTLRSNLSELQRSAFKAALRLVSPDSESLFTEFYNQAYGDNPTFPEYDMWVNVGGSQAMASVGNGEAYYYFK